MAKKSKKKKVQKIQKKEVVEKSIKKEESFMEMLSSRVKIGESYTSLLLGIVVVVVVTVLVVTFVKNNTSQNIPDDTEISDDIETSLDELTEEDLPTTYTIVEGDSLSSIAEKVYGSYDYWVEIAEENGITNPDDVPVGTKIKLPRIGAVVSPSVQMEPTTNQNIKSETYVVQEGDSLRSIATQFYGDSEKWPVIAKANNIQNPEIIEPGTKLVIPR